MSLAVLADHMASKGRGPDSMLIHMSPREVQGLQALAEKHGGSLTINPNTGLPEAGFLDKLLPAIIGFGISYVSGGTIDPKTAAMIVGGVQTARTGDIGKGIQAGLGAYGGAGIGAGMTAAGTEAIGSQAAGQSYLSSYAPPGVLEGAGGVGAGLSADMAYNLGQAGVVDAASTQAASVAQQAAAEKIAAASPFEKLSAGASKVASDPMSFATKDNFKYLAAGAAPILADQAVKSNMPKTTTRPGEIHSFDYNPYGGTFERYASVPTTQYKSAASGGIMGFDESANSPMSRHNLDSMENTGGMFNYAHDGGGVMKMAQGGIAGYAIGGDTKAAIDAAYAAGDYGKVNELAQANKITAADVADTYKGFDTSGLAGLGINLFTPPAQQAAAAAPAYTSYTPEQIGSYLTTNPTIDIGAATKQFNADPNVVNQYIASLDNPFRGSTDTTGGSGTLGIYNQMKAQGIDPNELYAANLAVDPKYAGWSQADIAKGYNLDKGAYALSDQLKGNVADKDWAKFMDTNGYSVNDMAQAFGISKNEVQRRYDAAKKVDKVDKVTPLVDTSVVTSPLITKSPFVDTTAGGTQAGVTSTGAGVYGPLISTAQNLPAGVSGGGNTWVNPNGTITTAPNIPGRPAGGFAGIQQVKDAYTTGGGSLGYVPYAPKTIDEFNAKYKNTGGSKAAYDYLMGKAPYSPIPVTPTGEIQKPYWESVGRFPENRSTKKYVFVDGKYQLNPDYVKPPYVQAAEKAASLSKQDTKPTYDPGTGNQWTWNSSASKWEATPIGSTATADASSESSSGTGGQAEGGLAALTMARGGTTHMPFFSKSTGKFTSRGPQVYADGGMSGQFNLGGYSDGGRLLKGPGDGVSDSIPATIGNKQPARLADGEFVVPARIVSELGNGSTEAGARKLYAMMDRVQAARKGSIGKGKVAKNSRADKYLPA